MLTESELAAVIGASATVVVALVGALLGRRWGLPGLGRQIEDQQAVLIDTLKDRIDVLEDQAATDAKRIASLERCSDQLASVERQLRIAHSDIAELSRRLLSIESSRP